MNIKTIELRSVILSGRHGISAIEKGVDQPLSVDVSLSFDAHAAIASEQLAQTIDYYEIVETIRLVIGDRKQPCVLLESLVDRVEKALAGRFPAIAIHVAIQKMQSPFRQKVSSVRRYFSRRTVSAMKSFEEMHDTLRTIGIASTPFLHEDEKNELLSSAEKEPFVRQSDAEHQSGVREDLSFCIADKESGVFRAVADRVVQYLYELEAAIGCKLFDQPLTNKEPSLQKYEKGSLGITPHRDEKNYSNLVCIIPLKGKGTLAICDDRSGSNALPVDTAPGNLILLRAPGYMGMSVRPLHVVKDIEEERIVLGIRFPRVKKVTTDD